MPPTNGLKDPEISARRGNRIERKMPNPGHDTGNHVHMTCRAICSCSRLSCSPQLVCTHSTEGLCSGSNINKNENPRTTLVSSVSSAIMLFMTSMFPLSAPCRQRLRWKEQVRQRTVRGLRRTRRHLKMIAPNERKRPNSTIETTAPSRYNKTTGLRPMWSERRFQRSAVTASAVKCRDIYEDYPLQRFLSKHE